MDDSQATRESLLIRLEDERDGQAWADFVDLYSPVIYGFARRHGLQDADAADLVQEVLRSVARSILKYDRRRGRFRDWLMTVVRRRLSEHWADRQRRTTGSGDSRVQEKLERVASDAGTERLWEQEYQQSAFRFAVARIRDGFEESTWQAFWQTTVEGKTTRQVAQSLDMSEGAVYIARSRVISRLKLEIRALEE